MNPKLITRLPTRYLLLDLCYYLIFGWIFYWIINTHIQPDLLHFKAQPFFAWDSAYFDYYGNLHNGILRVLSQFILQFMAKPLLGSISLTLLLLLLSSLLYRLFNLRELYFLKGIEFIIPALILYSLRNYTSGLEIYFIFLTTTLVVFGYTFAPKKWAVFRSVFQLASIYLVFISFGTLTTAPLVVFYAILDLSKGESRYRIINPIINFGFLILLIHFYLGFAFLSPIFELVNPENVRASMPMYNSLMVVLIALLIVSGLLFRYRNTYLKYFKLPWLAMHSPTLVLLLILLLVFHNRFISASAKNNAHIEFYSYNQEWDKALKLKQTISPEDRIAIFNLYRALYHTNTINADMYSLPQTWGVHSLLMTMNFTRDCTLGSSDLFYDMGFIKGAQYWALEAQTYNPYSPRVLKRLASCSMLLGDEAVARKYLNILSKSRIEHDWAQRMSEILDSQMLAEYKQSLYGELELEHDIIYINNDKPNLNLIQILRTDPKNKMAFDYLLTFYLLETEVGNFQFFLNKYGPYHYPDGYPDLYQQALLMYQMTKQIPDSDFEFTISQSVKDKMARFNRILLEYRLDDKMARKDLEKLFGDTYWFYVRYLSPKATGSSVKRRKI